MYVYVLFSLENMFKELSSDIKNFVTPDHGCLTGWAKQGLLIIFFTARHFIVYCFILIIRLLGIATTKQSDI